MSALRLRSSRYDFFTEKVAIIIRNYELSDCASRKLWHRCCHGQRFLAQDAGYNYRKTVIGEAADLRLSLAPRAAPGVLSQFRLIQALSCQRQIVPQQYSTIVCFHPTNQAWKILGDWLHVRLAEPPASTKKRPRVAMPEYNSRVLLGTYSLFEKRLAWYSGHTMLPILDYRYAQLDSITRPFGGISGS